MTIAGNYKLVQTVSEYEQLVDDMIAAGKPVGIDIEAGYDGPDRDKAALHHYYPQWKLVGISFTNSTSWARYVPIAHDSDENVDDVYTAAKITWKLLQSGLCVAHNYSYELAGFSRWFRDTLSNDAELGDAVRASKGLFPIRSDTMIEAFLMQAYAPPQQQGPGIGLKGLSLHKYDHKMTEFHDLFPPEDSELGPKTPKAKLRYVRFNTRRLVPKVVNYACEDALIALKLHLDHYPVLLKERPFILKVETALQPVLTEMEIEGLALDWDEYERRSADTHAFLQKMEEEIQKELSGRLGEVVSINLSSPAQVGDMLYNRLGLPIKKKTASGAASTDEASLRSLAKKDDTIKRMLEYREVKKLLGSYLDKYINELHYAEDGRAHPNHNQAGAATGRMSVDHVSYQQWPKKYHYELADGTTYDLNYKNFLISPEGFRLIGFDFSQVELRVLAGMANEEGLLAAFAAGTDIHKATASIMMGIPLDQVTDKDRAKGKTLNFAIVYGSGAKNIGELLGISTDEAQQLLDQYFRTFKGLKAWMDARVVEGTERGYVETLFGRKFKVWEYESPEPYIQAKGDRMCVNAPVQGGAADYMKIGMVKVNKAIKAGGLQDKIRLVITVHDNLDFYVHESVTTQEFIDLVKPQVSFPIKGLPEIKADWHEGKRWGEVFEVELDEHDKIREYSYKVELPDKSKVSWKGATWDEVADQYARWKANGGVGSAPDKVTGVGDAKIALAQELGYEASTHADFGLEVQWDQKTPRLTEDGQPWEEKHEHMPMALIPRGVQIAPLEPQPRPEVTPKLARILAPNAIQPEQMQLFAGLLKQRPGVHHVVLQTVGGERKLSGRYDLTSLDEDLLSDILGGARLYFEPLSGVA